MLEGSGAGTDTVYALVSFTLGNNVENLVLADDAGDIFGIGNAGANVLTGNGGNNMLDGAGGADQMIGGDGDDTYYVGQSGDGVVESADQGNDTVRSIITYTLGENVENLELIGTAAITGKGNAGDNVLDGIDNAAANVLRVWWGGDDTYPYVGAGATRSSRQAAPARTRFTRSSASRLGTTWRASCSRVPGIRSPIRPSTAPATASQTLAHRQRRQQRARRRPRRGPDARRQGRRHLLRRQCRRPGLRGCRRQR